GAFHAAGTGGAPGRAVRFAARLMAFQPQRVAAFDGIRAMAILPILVGHLLLCVEPLTRLDRAVVRIGTLGWYGVDLFFVLSGFLITGILLDTKGGARYFRTFYGRRLVR